MYVLLFFACSFLGWCMEVTCKLVQFGRFINRGFLLGPLCPIYGTGAVLMAYFLPLWTTQVESTFLLALVLCGTLEYITSWLMEKLFHAPGGTTPRSASTSTGACARATCWRSG